MGTVLNLLITLLFITVSCRVYAYTATYFSIGLRSYGLLSYANSSFVVSFSVMVFCSVFDIFGFPSADRTSSLICEM
jgi:hypothetical protein